MSRVFFKSFLFWAMVMGTLSCQESIRVHAQEELLQLYRSLPDVKEIAKNPATHRYDEMDIPPQIRAAERIQQYFVLSGIPYKETLNSEEVRIQNPIGRHRYFLFFHRVAPKFIDVKVNDMESAASGIVRLSPSVRDFLSEIDRSRVPSKKDIDELIRSGAFSN